MSLNTQFESATTEEEANDRYLQYQLQRVQARNRSSHTPYQPQPFTTSRQYDDKHQRFESKADRKSAFNTRMSQQTAERNQLDHETRIRQSSANKVFASSSSSNTTFSSSSSFSSPSSFSHFSSSSSSLASIYSTAASFSDQNVTLTSFSSSSHTSSSDTKELKESKEEKLQQQIAVSQPYICQLPQFTYVTLKDVSTALDKLTSDTLGQQCCQYTEMAHLWLYIRSQECTTLCERSQEAIGWDINGFLICYVRIFQEIIFRTESKDCKVFDSEEISKLNVELKIAIEASKIFTQLEKQKSNEKERIKTVSDKIDQLGIGKCFCLPLGFYGYSHKFSKWMGHAIYINFQKIDKDEIEVGVFNLGLGSENHPYEDSRKQPNKYKYPFYYSFNLQKTKEYIQYIEKARSSDPDAAIGLIYNYNEEYQLNKSHVGDGKLQTMGNCTFYSFCYSLRERLQDDNLYAKFMTTLCIYAQNAYYMNMNGTLATEDKEMKDTNGKIKLTISAGLSDLVKSDAAFEESTVISLFQPTRTARRMDMGKSVFVWTGLAGFTMESLSTRVGKELRFELFPSQMFLTQIKPQLRQVLEDEEEQKQLQPVQQQSSRQTCPARLAFQ